MKSVTSMQKYDRKYGEWVYDQQPLNVLTTANVTDITNKPDF